MNNMKRGFTITELVVVIVAISILVVIAGMGYGQWVQSSARKAIESDVKTVASAMEQEKNFHNAYPAQLPRSFNSASSAVNIVVRLRSGGRDFCLEARSSKLPGEVFHWIGSEGRLTEGGC